MDFNPEIVRRLADEGAEVTYGDAEDMDILEDVQMGITKVEGKHLGASLVIMELDTLLKLFRHPL